MVKRAFLLFVFVLLLLIVFTSSVEEVAYDVYRAVSIAFAIQSSGDQIVLVSDVEVSRTGIA